MPCQFGTIIMVITFTETVSAQQKIKNFFKNFEKGSWQTKKTCYNRGTNKGTPKQSRKAGGVAGQFAKVFFAATELFFGNGRKGLCETKSVQGFILNGILPQGAKQVDQKNFRKRTKSGEGAQIRRLFTAGQSWSIPTRERSFGRKAGARVCKGIYQTRATQKGFLGCRFFKTTLWLEATVPVYKLYRFDSLRNTTTIAVKIQP